MDKWTRGRRGNLRDERQTGEVLIETGHRQGWGVEGQLGSDGLDQRQRTTAGSTEEESWGR